MNYKELAAQACLQFKSKHDAFKEKSGLEFQLADVGHLANI